MTSNLTHNQNNFNPAAYLKANCSNLSSFLEMAKLMLIVKIYSSFSIQNAADNLQAYIKNELITEIIASINSDTNIEIKLFDIGNKLLDTGVVAEPIKLDSGDRVSVLFRNWTLFYKPHLACFLECVLQFLVHGDNLLLAEPRKAEIKNILQDKILYGLILTFCQHKQAFSLNSSVQNQQYNQVLKQQQMQKTIQDLSNRLAYNMNQEALNQSDVDTEYEGSLLIKSMQQKIQELTSSNSSLTQERDTLVASLGKITVDGLLRDEKEKQAQLLNKIFMISSSILVPIVLLLIITSVYYKSKLSEVRKSIIESRAIRSNPTVE